MENTNIVDPRIPNAKTSSGNTFTDIDILQWNCMNLNSKMVKL